MNEETGTMQFDAVVIGGGSLMGGEGSILGSVIGAGTGALISKLTNNYGETFIQFLFCYQTQLDCIFKTIIVSISAIQINSSL